VIVLLEKYCLFSFDCFFWIKKYARFLDAPFGFHIPHTKTSRRSCNTNDDKPNVRVVFLLIKDHASSLKPQASRIKGGEAKVSEDTNATGVQKTSHLSSTTSQQLSVPLVV
jgi:endoglucanase Acf2